MSPSSEATRGPLEDATPPPSAPPPSAPPPAAGGNTGTLGISLEEDAKILPGPPPDLKVEAIASGRLRLSWGETGLDILTHFQIYRRCRSETGWTRVGKKVVTPHRAKEFSFETENPRRECRYGVAAVDRYGNEGPRVETDELKR